MKIEMYSQEKLTFLKKIEEIFIEKVLKNDVFITDESDLYDFVSMFDISRSVKKLDNGKYLFKMKRSKDLFSNEYEEIEFEDEAVNDKQEYIDEVKKVFGVDISEVFSFKLPELFHYILINMPELNKKRLKLTILMP